MLGGCVWLNLGNFQQSVSKWPYVEDYIDCQLPKHTQMVVSITF